MAKENILGFVTLATGDDMYYKAAYRLLQSYRYQKGRYRFCIVCDRENKYTKHFDDVIVLEKCNFDYRDKFELLRVAPYERNIFIEPDCLVYKNIDDFWSMFKDASAVSAFGYNKGDLGVWFTNKEYVKSVFGVNEIPIFNPGYLYIEKSSCSSKCYEDLIEISKKILNDDNFAKEEKIYNGEKLRDDPIFCLAMEKNGCKCAIEQKIGKCVALPLIIEFDEIKMSCGRLDVIYNLNGEKTPLKSCYLLHFSSRKLKDWLYLQQGLVIGCLTKKTFFWCAKFIEKKSCGVVIKKFFKLIGEIVSMTKKHR